MTALGCDSTLILDLTIFTNSSSAIVETALDKYTSPSGTVYTTSGTYNDTIPNTAGCDSVITIDLTLQFTGLSSLISSSLSVYRNPTSNSLSILGLTELTVRDLRILTISWQEV
ncbi:MAG: hypothetical protein ACI865_002566 [Flavobacteriaceae bacterium]|jgi:hypothetical protein